MRILCAIFLCFITVVQATDDKYHFYFFYKDRGGRTSVMEKVFDRTVDQLGEQIIASKVRISDPAQAALLEKYQLKRSAMPHILVVAPNGVVTGRFALATTEQNLLASILCPGQENYLKALDKGKFVVLCMHKGDGNATRELRKFTSDRRFAKVTEVVALDDGDIREHLFLQKFGLDTHSHHPLTVLVAPSGKTLGVYKGNPNKELLISDLGLLD